MATLRINLERMFFNEILKLRPELRPEPQSFNRLEKLIDLPRLQKLKKRAIEPALIRQVVEQAEAVYVTAQLKSICMAEIEAETPKFVQYVESFKVHRNELLNPPFYALKAYELNKGPIDQLVGKKNALSLLKTISIVSKPQFYKVLRTIN